MANLIRNFQIADAKWFKLATVKVGLIDFQDSFSEDCYSEFAAPATTRFPVTYRGIKCEGFYVGVVGEDITMRLISSNTGKVVGNLTCDAETGIPVEEAQFGICGTTCYN